MLHCFQRSLFACVLALTVCSYCPAQQAKDSKTQTRQQSQSKEAEPPEEDDSSKPVEYAFNPLQAEKELQVGEFYLKKGSYGAAIKRFTEATKWNPTLADAYLKLGEAAEKYKDVKAAKEAYAKYLELAPDAKGAPAVRKKLQKM
jgi:tetratricopeptide (TPR) repeat protein